MDQTFWYGLPMYAAMFFAANLLFNLIRWRAKRAILGGRTFLMYAMVGSAIEAIGLVVFVFALRYLRLHNPAMGAYNPELMAAFMAAAIYFIVLSVLKNLPYIRRLYTILNAPSTAVKSK